MSNKTYSSQEKLIIYQLLLRLAGNTTDRCRPWGSIEENGCGKFKDLDDHCLEQIKQLGANHIWLTGVIEHASCTAYPQNNIPADNPLVVKGRAGSPYAIRDYYDVCPDLSIDVENRMEEFEALIARCRAAKLAPVIDFVPNHVARNYHSDQDESAGKAFGLHDDTENAFCPNNNFYYIPGKALQPPQEAFDLPHVKDSSAGTYHENPARATGNDCFSNTPSFNDWYETVKLNYGIDYQNNRQEHFDPVPDTWEKMLGILLFWAGKNVAGFRCDMAEMVPVAFWKWCIGKVREKYPAMLFIAEIYQADAYRAYKDAGFDYLYDKIGLYDATRDVLAFKRPAASLTEEWQKLGGLDDCMLRFIENHDEQRIASGHFAGNAWAGVPAMTVAATMHRGPAMIYFGQELGEEAAGATGFSGDDGRTSIFDYCHVPKYQKWFNHGKCSEERLNEEEKALRNFYKKLLALAKHPVISSGHFYDLMYANTDITQKSIYAYLRWDEEHIWLIATNFSNREHLKTNIRIPHHFWEISKKFNLDSQWEAYDLLNESPKHQYIQKNIIHSGLEVDLPPYSARIINVKKKL